MNVAVVEAVYYFALVTALSSALGGTSNSSRLPRTSSSRPLYDTCTPNHVPSSNELRFLADRVRDDELISIDLSTTVMTSFQAQLFRSTPDHSENARIEDTITLRVRSHWKTEREELLLDRYI